MTSLSTMLAEYRHSLLVEEQHAKSLVRDRGVNESYEGEVVNKQLEGVEFDCQCELDDKSPDSDPWICKFCGRVMQTFNPVKDSECECGGTFDEYDRCSECDAGHDDCSAQECFACMERLIDRAERMAEGDDR